MCSWFDLGTRRALIRGGGSGGGGGGQEAPLMKVDWMGGREALGVGRELSGSKNVTVFFLLVGGRAGFKADGRAPSSLPPRLTTLSFFLRSLSSSPMSAFMVRTKSFRRAVVIDSRASSWPTMGTSVVTDILAVGNTKRGNEAYSLRHMTTVYSPPTEPLALI